MIIISGASGGIGNYLMKTFKKRGERVLGLYHLVKPKDFDDEELYKIDLGDYSQVQLFNERLIIEDENLILFNCAGINYNALAHKADINEWVKVINVNLVGAFSLISIVLPYMRAKNYGRIINFSSVVARSGVPGTSAYAASKSALWGMSKAIAAENAVKGITINSLNLGYFNIGMIEQVPDKMKDIIKSKIPSGKFGDPENILNAVDFLISSDYINGETIDINGAII
jgi:acetoacetyl-CoA reductase/3-oxoacyl-[acyl-carrier protein] reductase